MAKKRLMISVDENLLSKIELACAETGISKSDYFSVLASKDLDKSEEFLKEFQKLLNASVESMKA